MIADQKKKKKDFLRESIRCIFIGDSVTEGQHINPQFRWTTLIANTFKKENIAVELSILNKGISGETTRQGLLRFASDVQANNPDIVVIQFGLNDGNCWVTDKGLPRVSEGSFRSNLMEMIIRAKHFGAKHVILASNHKTLRNKPLSGGKSLEEQRIRYNEIIREVAFQMEVVMCDIALAFEELAENELISYLLPEPDCLHLSIEGHQFYAKKMKLYIDAVLNQLIAQEKST